MEHRRRSLDRSIDKETFRDSAEQYLSQDESQIMAANTSIASLVQTHGNLTTAYRDAPPEMPGEIPQVVCLGSMTSFAKSSQPNVVIWQRRQEPCSDGQYGRAPESRGIKLNHAPCEMKVDSVLGSFHRDHRNHAHACSGLCCGCPGKAVRA